MNHSVVSMKERKVLRKGPKVELPKKRGQNEEFPITASVTGPKARAARRVSHEELVSYQGRAQLIGLQMKCRGSDKGS